MQVTGHYQNGGYINLWRDGVLKDTDPLSNYSTTPVDSTAPMRIGTIYKDSYFIGRIRRVAIFNRVLTQAEVEALYSARSLPEGSWSSGVPQVSGRVVRFHDGTQWQEVAAGGPAGGDLFGTYPNPRLAAGVAISPLLVDAKGDLLVGTADNAVGRLAVGSNAQVLTADTASPGGMKWAAAAAGGGPPVVPVTMPGMWTHLWPYPDLTTNAQAAGVLKVSRCYIAQPIKTIACEVSTLGSTTFRFAAYTDTPTGPGTLVATSAATIDASTTGMKQTAFVLNPGYYWIGLQNVGAASATLRCIIGQNPMSTGHDIPYTYSTQSAWLVTSQGSAVPSTWPSTGLDRRAFAAAVWIQAT